MSKELDNCPECRGKIIHSSFEKICVKCGLVIEKKAYKKENRRNIIPKNVLDTLSGISIHLNLSKNMSHYAAYYYKKIIETDEELSDDLSVLAFCVFYSIRKHYNNIQITLNDITKAFRNFGYNLDSKSILKEGLKYKHYLYNNTSPHKSEDYLIRLVDMVIKHPKIPKRLVNMGVKWVKPEFQNKLLVKCREILKDLPFNQRSGRNPFILTGAIIYLADKLLAKEYKQKTILTQRIISEATKIAEYSISDHYVDLLKPFFFNNK